MAIERMLLTTCSTRTRARGDSCAIRATRMLARAFPHVAIEARSPHASEGVIHIPARRWSEPHFDVFDLDVALESVADRAALFIDGASLTAPQLARAACEIANHYQRWMPRRNGHDVEEILARHRAAHDHSKPLVRADYEHTLDTWQWTLRLDPDASRALQAAALFHDIERLESEADVRIEHTAPDYQRFKDAHAEVSAQMVRRILAGALPDAELDRVAALVSKHERPRGDNELVTLNDADALSFFSVNASGFIRYFGEAHTQKKVRYTLGRLSPRARPFLARIRLRADLRAMVERAEEQQRSAA